MYILEPMQNLKNLILTCNQGYWERISWICISFQGNS